MSKPYVAREAVAGSAPSSNTSFTTPPLQRRREPGFTFRITTVLSLAVEFLKLNAPSISLIVRGLGPFRSIVPVPQILPANSYVDRVVSSSSVPPVRLMSNGTTPHPSFGRQNTRTLLKTSFVTTMSEGRMRKVLPPVMTGVTPSGMYDSSSRTISSP